jgi:hypothetical protein
MSECLDPEDRGSEFLRNISSITTWLGIMHQETSNFINTCVRTSSIANVPTETKDLLLELQWNIHDL